MQTSAIVVLGMHRSGTSALTGVLTYLGVDAGSFLLPAQETVNPKGFWEHKEIVELHEEILDALEGAWYDENLLPENWWTQPSIAPFKKKLQDILVRDFAGKSLWCVKDPRLCRLIPLWISSLSELNIRPKFIVMLRHPLEVAESLLKRDGIPIEKSCLLWLVYMLEAERATREHQRVFVRYNDLIADWQSVCDSLFCQLNLKLPITEESRKAISSFLEPSLRHFKQETLFKNEHPIVELAIKAHEVLNAITERNDIGNELFSIYHRAVEYTQLVGPWSKYQNHLLNTLQHRENEIRQWHADLVKVKSTYSWRLTKPFRIFTPFALRISKIFFSSSRQSGR